MALGQPVDNTCILFNGGKKILLSNSEVEGNEGIKLTKNPDGSWSLNIHAIISLDEADKEIFKFSDLNLPAEMSFDDAFPNMPFYSALDENEESIHIKLAANSELVPHYNRDFEGTITLKLNISKFGKTQNPKTQNAVVVGS